MRLYLYAESENKIGYLPDWIQVEYEESGKKMYLTLDIQAEICYTDEKLDCRCKGELIPWTLCDESGNEIHLSSNMSYVEEKFPHERIAEIIRNCEEFRVGIDAMVEDYKFHEAESDVYYDCLGRIEMYVSSKDEQLIKEFRFTPELLYE